MEKAFIISKQSEYRKDLDKYVELSNQQKEFINKYFAEKGIEALGYSISGNGGVNIPFEEDEKDNIKLSIDATENDVNKYGKMLCLKNEYGLRSFKKKSEISKDFAQRCIDEKVIINLWNPRITEYFKSIRLKGCGFYRFTHDNIMYIKIDSDYLDDKEVPEGFKAIKLSEFYIMLEEYKNQQKEE